MVAEFDKILIIDFLKAIKLGGIKGMSEERFEEMIYDFMEISNGPQSIAERRWENERTKLFLISGALEVLKYELMDKEMMEVLNNAGQKITKDNYPFDIIRINKLLPKLKKKVERLGNNLPRNNKKEKAKVNGKAYSPYDNLAALSMSLDGLYLDPTKVTVSEYLSYSTIAEKRSEEAQRSITKSKSYGNK